MTDETSTCITTHILLSGNDLLGVVELTVGAGADLVADGGLEIDVDGTGDVTALTGLGEEGGARIVSGLDAALAGHAAGGVDALRGQDT